MKKTNNILMVGADLSSNGGIATVVKLLFEASLHENSEFDLQLLKTTNYKDGNKISNYLIFIKAILKFTSILAFQNIHLVHFHSSSLNSFMRTYFLSSIANLFNRPIIIHIHSSNFDEYFIKTHKHSRIVKKVLNKYHIIVLCDDWYKKLIKKFRNAKIIEINNPIKLNSDSVAKRFNNSNIINILFIGFIIKSKGITDILTLAELFLKDNITVTFTIAGKGPLESDILKFNNKYKKISNVRYVGWADNSLKDKLLSNADVFFLPSYNEGMPMSILEAMTYKLPIISTNIAGIPQLVDGNLNGFLSSPGDINDFRLNILKLVHNADLRQEMGVMSYKMAKKFEYKKIYLNNINYYRRIIKGYETTNSIP